MTAGSNGTAHSRSQSNTQKLDHSVLRSSIDVSVTGMKQALLALENGNKEIRNYLFHECNVIYECKVCFNMFRSLANFLMHKRSYCEKQYCNVVHQSKPGDEDPYYEQEDVVQHTYSKVQHPCSKPSQTTVFVIPEKPVDTILEEEEWDINDYAPSLDLLQEAGILEEIEGSPVFDAIRAHKKKKGYQINSIAAKLKSKVDEHFDDSYYKSKLIRLEKMSETKNAVFQTVSSDEYSPTMGQQYNDLQKAQKLGTHLLGPDGKIIYPSSHEPWTANDPTKGKELSEKTMNKVKDSPVNSGDGVEKINVCPRCDKEFTSCSNVYRHLINVHGYTKIGAVRLKKQIIQTRRIKTKKKPLNSNLPSAKSDEKSIIPYKPIGAVSIAHFSKVDLMRAEECLKNQPKIKIPGKSMTRENNNIVENAMKLQQEQERSNLTTNKSLYVNNLYVQVNDLDSQAHENTTNDITTSSQTPNDLKSKSSNSYTSPTTNIHGDKDDTMNYDTPESSIHMSPQEEYSKTSMETPVDSDYESNSTSSRCSRSSRTSNTAMSSEPYAKSSLTPKDCDVSWQEEDTGSNISGSNDDIIISKTSTLSKSSRSSSKENLNGVENDISSLNHRSLSPNEIERPVQQHCLPQNKNSDQPKNGLQESIPATATKDFRRTSRTSKRTLESTNGTKFISLPDTPLEYIGSRPKKQTTRITEIESSSGGETCLTAGNYLSKDSKSALKDDFISGNMDEKETVTANSDRDFRRSKRFTNNAGSPSKPQYDAKDNGKEPLSQLENGGSDDQSNHSMLGTIKARRGVNGRAELQSNLSSIATNGLLRAVNLKARNITRSLPILSDLSRPPSPKKRKLT